MLDALKSLRDLRLIDLLEALAAFGFIAAVCVWSFIKTHGLT